MFRVTARYFIKPKIRHFSSVIHRRHLEDEGDWSYSREWWDISSSSNTVQREISRCGNGVVSVLAHASSQPGRYYWGGAEKWLQQRYAEIYPDFKPPGKFRVTGYEWRTLHFNETTRQSTVKVLTACREQEPSSVFLMQQAHCLAVPYVKSMVSAGLVTISSSNYNFIENAVNGKQIINILCIGHGGGSIPLFLASKIQGAVVHVVEIDPAVISASVKSMGFPAFSIMSPSGNRACSMPDPIDNVLWKGIHERLHLFNSDGEKFIQESTDIYDVIFIDAYDGADIFPHKLWQPNSPFIQALGNRLHPDHGTVVVNLHADYDSDHDLLSQQEFPLLLTGKYVSEVCHAYKDAILGKGASAAGIAYTVSVPWTCNASLVVGRGFGTGEGSRSYWSMALNTLLSQALRIEKLVSMPFSCLQYIKRGFSPVD